MAPVVRGRKTRGVARHLFIFDRRTRGAGWHLYFSKGKQEVTSGTSCFRSGWHAFWPAGLGFGSAWGRFRSAPAGALYGSRHVSDAVFAAQLVSTAVRIDRRPVLQVDRHRGLERRGLLEPAELGDRVPGAGAARSVGADSQKTDGQAAGAGASLRTKVTLLLSSSVPPNSAQ